MTGRKDGATGRRGSCLQPPRRAGRRSLAAAARQSCCAVRRTACCCSLRSLSPRLHPTPIPDPPQDTQLTGSIPPAWRLPPGLATLALFNNSMTGTLPQSVTQLQGLTVGGDAAPAALRPLRLLCPLRFARSFRCARRARVPPFRRACPPPTCLLV